MGGGLKRWVHGPGFGLEVMDGPGSAQGQAAALISRSLPSMELRQDGWWCLEGPGRAVATCFLGYSHWPRLGPLSWVLLCIRIPCHAGALVLSSENGTLQKTASGRQKLKWWNGGGLVVTELQGSQMAGLGRGQMLRTLNPSLGRGRSRGSGHCCCCLMGVL